MVKSYDLALVVCTVNGIAISGYGETDAVQLEWAADIVEATKTADGEVIYSRLNDRECSVTVNLSQKSKAYGLLMEQLEAQHGDNAGIHPASIAELPFSLVDPSTGDTITSQVCVFMSRPAPSKGKTVGEVQFKLSLPSPKVSFGTANTT